MRAKYVFGGLTLGDVLEWAEPDSVTLASDFLGSIFYMEDGFGVEYQNLRLGHPRGILFPLSTKVEVFGGKIVIDRDITDITLIFYRQSRKILFDDIILGNPLDRIHGVEQ